MGDLHSRVDRFVGSSDRQCRSQSDRGAEEDEGRKTLLDSFQPAYCHRRGYLYTLCTGLDDPSPDTNFGGLGRGGTADEGHGSSPSSPDLTKGDSGVSRASSSSSRPHLAASNVPNSTTGTIPMVNQSISSASTAAKRKPGKPSAAGQAQTKQSNSQQKIFKDKSSSPTFAFAGEEEETDKLISSGSAPGQVLPPPPAEVNPELAAAIADAELKTKEAELERKRTVRYAAKKGVEKGDGGDREDSPPAFDAKDSQTTQATA